MERRRARREGEGTGFTDGEGHSKESWRGEEEERRRRGGGERGGGGEEEERRGGGERRREGRRGE